MPTQTGEIGGRRSELLDPEASNPEELRQWLGLSQEEFSRVLGVARRTVARWAANPPDHSSLRSKSWNRLARVYRLQFLLEVLVGKGGAASWLRCPNKGLDGGTPLDLLMQGEIERVIETLELVASGGEY